MEKLGQLHAGRPQHRPLGPDRRRHPAVALGAGLPRRPGAALGVPRRPVHPAAARAGQGPGPADDRRASAWSPTRWPRSLGAQVLKDLQTFVAAFDTLFGGFRQPRPADLRAAPDRGDGVPGRRGPGAGRAARGGVLRRAARRGADAARRAGRQPGHADTPAGSSRPSRRSPRRSGSSRRRTRRPGSTAGAAAAARRPDAAGSPARRGCGSGSRRPTRTCRRPSCRRCRPTCTTSTACARSATCSPREVARPVTGSLTRAQSRAGSGRRRAPAEQTADDGGHVARHARSRAADATR